MTIKTQTLQSAIGPMFAAVAQGRLCLLEFSERRMLPTQLKLIQKYFAASLVEAEDPIFVELQTQLDEYFRAERLSFELPLALPGTAFQRRVWQRLQAIEYGHSLSYQQLATSLGEPSSARAVACANGANRLAIIVPCHRVVGSDGQLVGYGGKIWRKRYLLDLEAGRLPASRPASIRADN